VKLLIAAAAFLAGWLVGVQVERIHGWAHPSTSIRWRWG
jgi:hypothetical protein